MTISQLFTFPCLTQLNLRTSSQMSFDGDVSRLAPQSRTTRSHSLKPQSQPIVFKQRSKRTMSLPSKPVLLPLINVQRCYENWSDNSDDDEGDGNEIEMGKFHY